MASLQSVCRSFLRDHGDCGHRAGGQTFPRGPGQSFLHWENWEGSFYKLSDAKPGPGKALPLELQTEGAGVTRKPTAGGWQ